VGSCVLDPAGFSSLRQWIADQSSAWEKNLDRLGEILEKDE
jgi:hypothetical protein